MVPPTVIVEAASAISVTDVPAIVAAPVT
jgi:hypothetical protein